MKCSRASRQALGVAGVVLALAATASAVAGHGRRASDCVPLRSDQAYTDAVFGAVGAKEDVWGTQLVGSQQGPTYAAVRAHLHPLLLVGRPAGLKPTRLTDSGVYYLPFGRPKGTRGASAVDLHVADGSQVVSQLANGPRLTVSVGTRGTERYGSCLRRLDAPRLSQGYLPILETSYADADGVRYRRESFATRIPQTGPLVSFVRLSVDPRGPRVGRALLRFTVSDRGLTRVGRQLRLGRGARLLFTKGARLDGRSVVFTARRPRVVYVAWLNRPSRTRPVRLHRATYDRARRSVAAYWVRRLAAGGEVVVPERRVNDAERSLLIQNLLMSWRYSLGNSYERFSWELIDVAEVMGAYGYRGVERTILQAARGAQTFFRNRAAGEQLDGSADYCRGYGGRSYVATR